MKLRKTNKDVERRIDTVLIRIDTDVPMNDGKIRYHGDDRLKSALPEIQKWVALKKHIVLLGHAGRPGGKRVRDLSLAPVAKRLSALLKQEVVLASNVKEAGRLRHKGTGIILLENLRYDAGERKNSKRFAKRIASLGDIYVNNAFSVCHRKHASMHAIHQYIDGYAGGSVLSEVAELSRPLRKPHFLVLGGIKLETRLSLLHELAPCADGILLGSGIATVIAGDRSVDFAVSAKERRIAKQVLRDYAEKLVFPVDVRMSQGFVVDIGPGTLVQYDKILRSARSIIWNGPLGRVEVRAGMKGTYDFADVFAAHSARTVVGGGDTVGYLRRRGKLDGVDFVSTGGGAMLRFLSGGEMPGLERLKV